MKPGRYYSLVPGVDVIALSHESALLRSDTSSFRLDGPAATVLAGPLGQQLRGAGATLDAMVVPGVEPAAIAEFLEQLVAAGIVRVTAAPARVDDVDATLEAFLTQLGRQPRDADALRSFAIGILGVSAHGAHVASQLATVGIGRIRLLDPSPLRPGHVPLVPPTMRMRPDAAAELASMLTAAPGASRTRVEVTEGTDRDAIERFIADLDLVISCVDQGASVQNIWLNEASLASRKPVIYTRLAAHRALVGPLVTPPVGPCYLCSRMRTIACEPDFEAAMAYEEWSARQREPAFDRRAVLPGIALYISGLAVADALKYLLGLGPPSLTCVIHEFNGLTFATTRHALLPIPDCPACGSPGEPVLGPALPGLSAASTEGGDLLGAATALVSAHCGVVSELVATHKDPSEPEIPYLYNARLSNRRFGDTSDAEQWICSGKGSTVDGARRSVLGETIERYGSISWRGAPLRNASLRDVDAPVFHPRDLVLFDPSQYATLPYAPVTDDTVFGWVRGRDLVSGEEVLVPAIGVLMDYAARSPQERIAPVTSNGLGGGSTLLEAVLAGANEVVERDAFVATWLGRLPARKVDPLGHPDGGIRDVVRSYARRGVDIELYRLRTDHPVAVFTALAVARDEAALPAVVVGLGADVDPAVAAGRAVLEVGQMRPTMLARVRHRDALEKLELLVADPASVATMEDHALLYASPQTRAAFDFLRSSAAAAADWASPARDALAKLQALVDWCARRSLALVYCDLTPADMRALRLYSVRTLISGFQPIHFGERERRLGGDRLFQMPRMLGFSDAPLTMASLNPCPHPLA